MFQKEILQASLALVVTAHLSSAQVTINEVDADTPGSDSAEFVELFNADLGNVVSLDGYVLVFFNGGDTGVADDPATPDLDESEPADGAYLLQDLSGHSIAPGGFFVFGNPGVPNVNLQLPPGGAGAIQNGTDAVALYNGATAAAFLTGDLAGPTTVDLVDAVVHATGDGDDVALQNALGLLEQFDESVEGNSGTDSIQRNPDGATTFEVREATPGNSNFALPALELELAPLQIDESSGVFASTGTIIRGGDLSSAVSVSITVTSGDGNRIKLSTNQVEIGAGFDFEIFDIDSVSNVFTDGDAVLTIEVSALGFTSGFATLVVTDDETPAPTLVINEVLADGGGSLGAEYIELFNAGVASVVLDGYSVEIYEVNPSFGKGELRNSILIDSGTITPRGFFTIGNEFVSSVYEMTPDLEIGGLDLDDSEFSIVLVNDGGEVVFSALLFDPDNDLSANRAGEVIAADILISDPATGFEPVGFFLTADGGEEAGIIEFVDAMAAAPSATPGFSNTTFQLTIAADLTTIVEDSVAEVSFTVTRFPDASGDVSVTLASSDLTELTVPTEITIFDGESIATFVGIAVDDGEVDGSQTVTVSAALGGLMASAEVIVLDANAPALAVCEIAFIGYAADNPDFFAVVALSDISSGAQINFTDNGWLAAGGFRPGEGVLTWIAPNEGVSAGTVISFENDVPSLGTASGSGPVLSASGDQLFAFQGSLGSPILLAGLQMNGDWDDDAIDTSTSAEPVALSFEGGLTLLSEVDNAVYAGITTGSLAQLKSALFDPSNFIGGNARDDIEVVTLPSAFVIGEPSIYTVSIVGVSMSNGQFVLNFTASGLSDVYRTTDLRDFDLAPDGGAVVSGTYTDTSAPAERSFYLIQEAGSPAP